jgi:hypothetical protein
MLGTLFVDNPKGEVFQLIHDSLELGIVLRLSKKRQ